VQFSFIVERLLINGRGPASEVLNEGLGVHTNPVAPKRLFQNNVIIGMDINNVNYLCGSKCSAAHLE
jgi:hypothetical protein